MIFHRPKQLLKKIAPKSKIKRLVNEDLTLNKTALSLFSEIDFISKGKVELVALKVIKQYKDRYKNTEDTKAEVIGDKELMVNRVQSTMINEISSEIKDTYRGEFYIWLPSEAANPDPIHQLNYGQRFQIGVGEMPGDRFGCQCGMQILTSDEKLEL